MRKPSLNHIYRIIWSEALNAWVAVSELASAKGKRSASGILKKALSASALCAGSFSSRNEISRIRPLTLALILCFGVEAHANPIGAQVVNGTAAISQAGNTLTVANSPNAIINWQGFSINPNETTRFVQQNAASAVLNRVVGPDLSQLLGALTSNGKVFLVNPAGILAGQGARIDVAGFVASTLNLSDADFLAGKLNFTSGSAPLTSLSPQAGEGVRVINQGSITTPDGGSVYLIAPNVTNEGIITTPGGETLLAAGNTVQLVDTGTPGVSVQIGGADNTATNLGQILADSGRIGITGAMVRNSGTLSASSLVNEGGRVFLRASRDSYVEGNGRIEASGIKGGSIEVLGNRVAIADNASIDASGQNAGGTVLVGGDYQGKNPGVQNAQVTYFSSAATLSADAMQNGNGGKVIVWADNTTRAYGSISARGGANGGDGGFVEVSGKGFLDFRAQVDSRAPLGKYGTLLLDPTNIIVQAANPDILGTAVSAIDITAATDLNPATNFPGVTSIITSGALAGLLNGADVTLAATNDIAVNDIVSWTTGTFALTLDAGNNISINAALDSSGTAGGDIALTAGNAINLGANLVSTFNATPQGMVTLTAGVGGVTQTAGAITANSLKISSGGGVILNGANDINTLAGSVTGTGFQYTDANGFAVGTVGGTTGLTVASGDTALKASGLNSLLTVSNNVQATTGSVFYAADNLAHNAFTTTSGVAGKFVEVKPFTSTTQIEFSALADAAGLLRLSSTELNFSTPLLRVGNAAVTGGIAFTQSVAPTAFSSLGLFSAGAITQAAGATISTASLSANGLSVNLPEANPVGDISGSTTGGDFICRSVNQLTLSNVAGVNGISVPVANNIGLDSDVGINQQTGSVITTNGGGLSLKTPGPASLLEVNGIGTLAADLNPLGLGTGAFELNSASALTVGTVLGISGITANNNNISISTAANQTLTIAQPVNAGTGVGSNVLLEADTLALNNTVTADLVSVTPFTANRNITVGSATCNAAPCLNVVDLWRIAAPTIGIGGDAASFLPAGAVHVAGITSGGAAVTDRNAATTRIGLLSGAGVTQGGAIAVADLGVSAGGAVALNATNMVSNLVGYTTTGGFSFNNGQGFRITSVSGGVAPYDYNMSGITALSGDVSLTAAGAASDITANTPGMNFIAIDAVNGNVTLNAGRDVLIGNGVDGRWADIYADGAAKDISITAGRHVLIDNFTYVHSFAGNVTLTATSGNVSIRSSVNGLGTWVGAGTNGTGGVVTINAPAGSVLAPAAGFGGDVGGGYITAGGGGTLSVSAQNGIILNGANAVSSFTASNATTGGVVLTNTSIPLIVNSIVNTGGAVTLINYGPLTVSAGGIAALGAVALTSGSAGSANAADIITLNGTVSGSSVVLAANSVAGTIPAGATVRDLAAVTAVANAVNQTTAATPAVTTVAATTTAANTAATTTTTTATASTGTATSAPPTAPVVIDTVAVTGTTSGSAFTMVGPTGGTIGGATGTFGGAEVAAPTPAAGTASAGAAAEPSSTGSGAAGQGDAAGTEEGAQSSAAASTDDSANKDDAAEQNGDNGNGEEQAIEKSEKC